MKLLLLLLTLFLPISVYKNLSTTNMVKERINEIDDYEYNYSYNEHEYLEDIDYNTFKSLLTAKEEMIVLFTQTGCIHCENYLPTYKNIISKNNMSVPSYNLNISKLSNDEYEKLKEEVSFSGTPTTIYFKDGYEEEKISGNVSEESLTTKLEAWGCIK